MNKLTEAFVKECEQLQEWKVRWEANHIQFENYFNYSGKVEEDTEEWKEYMSAQNYANIKAEKLPKLSRKEYFKQYWLQNKYKQIYLKQVKNEK